MDEEQKEQIEEQIKDAMDLSIMGMQGMRETQFLRELSKTLIAFHTALRGAGFSEEQASSIVANQQVMKQ